MKDKTDVTGMLKGTGETCELFRMALEGEINRWSGFANALRKPDREAFEELIGICRNYASESSRAPNPIIFEPVVMSILLFQQIRLRRIERELQPFKPAIDVALTSQERGVPDRAEGKDSVQAAVNRGKQSCLF